MTKLTLRLLRSRGIITGDVIPFARAHLVETMVARHADKVVMRMGEDVRPGPYWLVSSEDAVRLQAAGYKQVDQAPQ